LKTRKSGTSQNIGLPDVAVDGCPAHDFSMELSRKNVENEI
jgi:hypothetical protein